MQDIFKQQITIVTDVLSQEVHGETVLLDLNKEYYFGLNQVGTRIWQLIQEGIEISKIYDLLLEEYNVDEDELRNDIREIILKLKDAGLIELK